MRSVATQLAGEAHKGSRQTGKGRRRPKGGGKKFLREGRKGFIRKKTTERRDGGRFKVSGERVKMEPMQ